MDSSLKKIIRLEYLIIFLIVLVFLIFDFYPMLRQSLQLGERIKMAKMAVKTISQTERDRQQKELEEALNQTRENWRVVQEATNKIKGKVGEEKNIALVTLAVEDLAAASEVELGSVKPLESKIDGKYEIQFVEIGLQGKYGHVIDFLSRVEDESLFIAVDNLIITRGEEIYPMLDIQLTLYVLFKYEGDQETDEKEG